jgi:hypothetical protein
VAGRLFLYFVTDKQPCKIHPRRTSSLAAKNINEEVKMVVGGTFRGYEVLRILGISTVLEFNLTFFHCKL